MSENGRGAEWANSEALEAAIGELREMEEECPGVWYVSTYGGEQAGREFYVVARDAETIPDEAKTYGTDIPGCPGYLLYPMDAQNHSVRDTALPNAGGRVGRGQGILARNRP